MSQMIFHNRLGYPRLTSYIRRRHPQVTHPDNEPFREPSQDDEYLPYGLIRFASINTTLVGYWKAKRLGISMPSKYPERNL